MVYSPDGPIRRRKRGDILTMDQSDAGSAGIFSRWTNRVLRACTGGRARHGTGAKRGAGLWGTEFQARSAS
eukprot:1196415-Prorocentrum_minimum.AAC.2